MSCDICKHEHDSKDILCPPCREMMARLTRICRANPDILSPCDNVKSANASKATWWAGAAGAKS